MQSIFRLSSGQTRHACQIWPEPELIAKSLINILLMADPQKLNKKPNSGHTDSNCRIINNNLGYLKNKYGQDGKNDNRAMGVVPI